MERITDKLIRGLATPERGRRIIFDDTIKGFGIQVLPASKRNPGGARTFLLDYRAAGVQRRLSIGNFPAWSVEAARKRAKKLRQEVDTGADPMAARHQLRTAPTVADLAKRYCTEHLPKNAKASQKRDREMLDRDILPALRRRRVTEVHQGDIRALHQRVTARGAPVRANRVLSLCSCLFALAMEPREGEAEPWLTAGQGNPAKGIKRNPEEGRERYFSEAELDRIAGALNEYPGTHVANLLRFCMLTGCRPSEAIAATWSEFNLETGEWKKPSAHTKTRKAHRVPLAPAAVELVAQARKAVPEDCPLLFPGRKLKGKDWERIKEYRIAWGWVRNKAKLEPDADGRLARVYDLRHSFASIGAGQGLSLLIIGKLLGHTQARTTEKYAHIPDDPLRQAAEKIVGAIANAGKTSDNVVPIKGGRGA